MAEALGGGASGYFANNYYQDNDKAPGRWYGKAAKQLALHYDLEHPTIDTEQWSNLFNGYSPNGDEKFVQNAGKNTVKDVYQTRSGRQGERSRKPGWDISYDVPKSVSVLWSQSNKEERQSIERAHRAAVNVATNYLVGKVGFTRTGRMGVNVIPAHPLIAIFEHYDSRANDPQLHSHTVYLNITVDEEQQTRSLSNSRPLYTHQLNAFALYRAELSRQLSWNLGYELEAHQSTQMQAFEIRGVPQELLTQFSKRGEGIKAELARRGFANQQVEGRFSKLISLELRPAKREIPLNELLGRWAEEAQPFGFEPNEIEQRSRDIGKLKANLPTTIRQVLEEALEKLTTVNNTFTQLQLERAVFECAVAHQVGHYIVEPSERLLSQEESQTNSLGLSPSARLVPVGQWQGQMRYTTRGMVQLEQQLLSNAREIARSAPLPVQAETVREEIARSEELGVPLDAEQQAAVWYLTTSNKGLKVLTGWAGTGKTRIFETVERIVAASDGRTLGMALAGKAADELERKSGVKSNTVHKTVYALERDNQGSEFVLDAKTVVLLDEASMVSLSMAERAFAQIAAAQATLIVIGDDKQLPAVEAGGVLKALKAEFEGIELQDIKRQPEPEQKQLVYDIAEGSPTSVQRAVQYLAQNGLLVLEGTRQAAVESMVKDWKVFGGLTRPEETQMIAMTNQEVNVLNEAAQLERWFSQQLEDESFNINGQFFHAGDRIVFRPNPNNERPQFNRHGVRNGAFGTITALDAETGQMTIELDGSGKEVTLPEDFQDIRLGYAATTHVMQGSDTRRALILIGGTMQTHQQSYVQMSRHTEGLTLYTDRDTAGRDLSELISQMTRDGSKHFASALLGRELTEELIQVFEQQTVVDKKGSNDLQAQWESIPIKDDWHEERSVQMLFEDEAAWEQAFTEALEELEDLIEQGQSEQLFLDGDELTAEWESIQVSEEAELPTEKLNEAGMLEEEDGLFVEVGRNPIEESEHVCEIGL